MGIIYDADDPRFANFYKEPAMWTPEEQEYYNATGKLPDGQSELIWQAQQVPPAPAGTPAPYNPYATPFVPQNYVSNSSMNPALFRGGLQPTGFNQFGRPTFDLSGLLNSPPAGLLTGEG